MALTEEQRDALIEAINADVEGQVEYATTHEDAGDAYAFMLTESHITHHEWRSIRAFAADNDLTLPDDDDLPEFQTLLLDYAEMQSGGIYYPTDVAVLAGYPVGEVESQHEFANLSAQLGFTVTADDVKAVSGDVDAHISDSMQADSFLTYSGTDSVWYHIVTLPKLREALAAFKASQAD